MELSNRNCTHLHPEQSFCGLYVPPLLTVVSRRKCQRRLCPFCCIWRSSAEVSNDLWKADQIYDSRRIHICGSLFSLKKVCLSCSYTKYRTWEHYTDHSPKFHNYLFCGYFGKVTRVKAQGNKQKFKLIELIIQSNWTNNLWHVRPKKGRNTQNKVLGRCGKSKMKDKRQTIFTIY